MAIDSLRKRASIAPLGLAFFGPSVIPDGSFAVGDRQAIANSYYGIASGNPSKTIGGTSQLEAFTSSGTIVLAKTIGGTSQLEAYLSSGGIDVVLPKTIGGVSQLEVFTSTGFIDSGAADEFSGGFADRGERRRTKKELERQRIDLGILPKREEKRAEKAVEKAAEAAVELTVAKPETQAATEALKAQMAAQKTFEKVYEKVYPTIVKAEIQEQFERQTAIKLAEMEEEEAMVILLAAM